MLARVRAVIALVDDDPRVLEAMANLLESEGYSVRLYASAEAALAAPCIGDVDCLIADIYMPGMDGFELQRRVGTVRPELPVILFTARYEANSTIALAHNNRGIFQKPVESMRLLAALDSALGAGPAA